MLAPYELMIQTNHCLIDGGDLNDAQKANITRRLLSARSTAEQAQRFYRGVRAPGNIDSEGRRMYPIFYIPPYNSGKKLQTVIPMSPKTHILSANAYELEIIRLLHLFAPNDPDVRMMVTQTLERLKTTCFGYHGCARGECFHSALIVLRFLIAVSPDETEWIQKLIAIYHAHVGGARRHSGVKKYFELCMKEMNP
ncbi:MAG: hypothetical protein LBI19_09800 [Oscillospiraceae bacterium]|jgi:hypothetical protein|nr:hypothetical protein [Oscillospiraceae bacterium]